MGHFALGYVFGRLTAKAVKTRANIPAILMLSVIPDVDILIPFLEHRGPTHSIVIETLILTPFFLKWRRKVLPYFAALIQHSLLGDFLAGGEIQLFWPITHNLYGVMMDIESAVNVTFEWMLFILFIIVMFGSGDLQTLFRPHSSNLLLLIPLITVILPTFLNYPLNVPLPLIPLHLFFMVLFLVSVLIDLSKEFALS